MGFRLLLLGFIFIFFQVNIGSIDLLPDVIGYILIFSGTKSLRSFFQNDRFVYVTYSSLLLIPLSTLDLFIRHSAVLNGVVNNALPNGKVFSLIFTTLTTFLLIYCVYHVCKGIEQEAQRIGNAEVASKSVWTCWLFLSYKVVTFLFIAAGILFAKDTSGVLNLNQTAGAILFVLLFLYMLSAAAQLFILLNESKKVFANTLPQ
ncbi:hypothetical protein [Sporolactobacillus laevolacticus]|uniref:hypothetical protein n=1 Tax=Sporolactobacillus laevolacticus TaxID=33018 RepID=UPI0025B4E0AB|nr:hypothetical protein [Sporolactobacillus laevolacticus]MDN3954445.1 hypothetical protein [Sporolactobacillus laevolacticus]